MLIDLQLRDPSIMHSPLRAVKMQASSRMDMSKADQVHLRCPVTLGLIEATTGEPITESFKKRRGYKAGRVQVILPAFHRSRVQTKGVLIAANPLQRELQADVLRDEWAPYDISSQAYGGGFRYRRFMEQAMHAGVAFGVWEFFTRKPG